MNLGENDHEVDRRYSLKKILRLERHIQPVLNLEANSLDDRGGKLGETDQLIEILDGSEEVKGIRSNLEKVLMAKALLHYFPATIKPLR